MYPLMVMKKGDHVRWYVATLGDFFNGHTPHWHGNTVLVGGQRTDVLNIASAQMITSTWFRTRLASGSTIATSRTTCWPEWTHATRCCRAKQPALRRK